MLQDQITHMTVEGTADGATSLTEAQVDDIKRMYNMAIMAHACVQSAEGAGAPQLVTKEKTPQHCATDRRRTYAVDGIDPSPAIPAGPDMQNIVDPSFMQVALSYAFADTSVGVSWYQSSDAVHDGSELTAIGAGVNHALPKLGVNIYAAAQNYSVDDGSYESDDTVVMIGARIKF